MNVSCQCPCECESTYLTDWKSVYGIQVVLCYDCLYKPTLCVGGLTDGLATATQTELILRREALRDQVRLTDEHQKMLNELHEMRDRNGVWKSLEK